MSNPTFLATVQPLGSDEIEFIESSDYSNADAYAKFLDQSGYIVKDVVGQDQYKMW